MPESAHLEKAKQLLVHYFRQAGVVREGDNVVEIEEIVDEIAIGVEERIRDRLESERHER